MKKIFTKLIGATLGLAMAVGVGVGIAANNRKATMLDATPVGVTFTAGTDQGSNGASGNGDTMTKSPITISGTNLATTTAQYRVYKDCVLTISTSSGDITSVVFTSTANKGSQYGPDLISPDTGTYTTTTGSKVGSWEGTASSIDFSASAQARFSSIVVTYDDGGSGELLANPAPTYSNGNITWTVDPHATSYDLSINGEDPIHNATTPYSTSGFAVPGGYTVTVTAIGDGVSYLNSSGSTSFALLTKAGTQAEPYDVANARAAIDGDTGVTGVYATGIVSAIVEAYNSEYGNITYDISYDGLTTSDQLRVYRGKNDNGEWFTSEDDVEVGATVVVYGNLVKFGATYEFAQDNQLKSYSLTKYNVTFNSLGGSEIASQIVKKGSCIATLPVPTKNKDTVNQKKFEFAGWYTVADPEHPVFEEVNRFTNETPVNSDLVLYAKYNETNYYIVTFNSNGGTVIPSQEVDSGEIVLMPANPEKAPDASYTYTFEGWYTNVGLTDAFVSSTPITSNLTLYANYTQEAISSPEAYLSSATSFATIHGSETPAGAEQTASSTINDLVTANGWEVSSGTTVKDAYTSFDLDANINVSTTGEPNCGTIWGTTTHDWRLYQNKGGDIVLTADNGYALSSVKFTFNISSNGVLKFGEDTVASNSKVDLSGTSATFTVGATSGTSGQVRVTAIEVKYAIPMSVNNVALRFGATIAKSDWDSINDNGEHPEWEITDYGVMLFQTTAAQLANCSTVKQYFEADPANVYVSHKGSGTAPYLDGDNYLFTVKVSVASDKYDMIICAAPFVKVGETYYFLQEQRYSVRTLAQYYRTNGGSGLSNDALDILAGN